jgi:hypothetical protein
LQSAIGVYGQKFSATGTRLWADSGLVVKPLDGNSFASLSSLVKDTSILGYYMEIVTAGNTGLAKAFNLNRSGVLQWGGNIITPGAAVSGKGRMSTAITQNGMSILAFQDNRNDAGGIYAQNINFNGTFGPPTGIINVSELTPEKYSLSQNYPNPFNPSTTIKFDLAKNGFVSIKIYDVLGREIKSLVNDNLNKGSYEISFNAGDISSGVYFYKMVSGDFSQIKRMMLLK